jgi:hypothetical protein
MSLVHIAVAATLEQNQLNLPGAALRIELGNSI